MNYVVVNSVCCCLSVCCKQFWQSMYRIVGKQAFIKVAYCLIYYGSLTVSILLAYIMDSSWFWFFRNFAPGIDCFDKDVQHQVSCLSFSLLYRDSLSLFIFSIFMLIVLKLCSSRIALIINETLFFTKFVIIMLLILIFMRVNNQFFMSYGQFCKVVSYVFVICQQIILIDLAYLWGIKWVKIYVDGHRTYAGLLIGGTIVMFVGCFGFIVSGFMYHHDQLVWINILSTVFILTMVGVQLLYFNKQNSLLTTSALCLLVSYYTWSAGWSHPLSQPIISTQSNAIYKYPSVLILNLIISTILLMFSTAGSIYGSTNQEQQNRFIDLDNPNAANQQELQHQQRNKWAQWLLFLAGMSTYIPMIFTDWGSADIVKKQFNLTTGAWTSKIIMATTVFIIYVWTLLAPKLCPNRNFYFQ